MTVFWKEKVPRMASIETIAMGETVRTDISKIDISKIYENDLFDTYQQREEHPEKKALLELMPPPPLPIAALIPETPAPKFLEPVGVTLRGIIMLGDDAQNRAIITYNKTKQEGNYRIGDMIDDAVIVRIESSRVLLVRSNGQEESLYLREKDALHAGEVLSAEQWEQVIRKEGGNRYEIDPVLFIEFVPNLAQGIDQLDLITVYRKGKAIGVRVGVLPHGSFGFECGLSNGDILTEINGIAPTTIENRMRIYKNILENDTLVVKLLRNTIAREHTYVIREFEQPMILGVKKTKPILTPASKMPYEVREEKQKELETRHTFAPTISEIKKREKESLLTKIKRTEDEARLKKREVRFDL